MAEPSTLPSTPKAIRQLIEHYTPDGTAGRLLLAVATGLTGFLGLWITAIVIFAGTTLATLTFAPIAGAITGLLFLVTVLTVWPVYLSAIGRVESPTAYSRRLRRPESPSRTERVTAAYRSGDLSEEELERRLETSLADDGGKSEASGDTTRDQQQERAERATE